MKYRACHSEGTPEESPLRTLHENLEIPHEYVRDDSRSLNRCSSVFIGGSSNSLPSKPTIHATRLRGPFRIPCTRRKATWDRTCCTCSPRSRPPAASKSS